MGSPHTLAHLTRVLVLQTDGGGAVGKEGDAGPLLLLYVCLFGDLFVLLRSLLLLFLSLVFPHVVRSAQHVINTYHQYFFSCRNMVDRISGVCVCEEPTRLLPFFCQRLNKFFLIIGAAVE